jgi:hypothetical protein
VDMRHSLGAPLDLSGSANETRDDSRRLAFNILQGMAEKALDAAGFESPGDEYDVWKKDGVWFGRIAALDHNSVATQVAGGKG